jgi:IS5 family transposase
MKKATKKNYRVRNWRQYNEALVNRGSLTMWVSEEVISAWVNAELSGSRGASRYYSDVAIECMLTLQVVYHLALRQTEGLMRSIVDLLGVELAIPDHTTLCRRRKSLSVSLQTVRSGEPLHLVVDSTGVKIYGEGEWKVRQHGYSKRRTWRMVHLGVDQATHQIHAAIVTTNDVSEAECFAELLEQVDGPICQISGDGAYDKRKVYTAISDRNARSALRTRAAIPPRHGARIWKHGNTSGERLDRDENLRHIRRHGRSDWKRHSGYHRRSIAETAMFRLKQLFGATLSARLFESQCCEAFIRCAALNRMTALGMPDSYPLDV